MYRLDKTVVFDLDETIGHFSQLGVFYDGLERYLDKKLPNNYLEKLLKLYPEFFRPGLITILNYLKKQKQRGKCKKVMIYTNNQGPNAWANGIVEHIHDRLDYDLFDRVIRAFKIRDKKIEVNRTTHNKTIKDFLKCTRMPATTQIFFLDDQFHPKMECDNVYYFHLEDAYTYEMSSAELIKRFLASDLSEVIHSPKSGYSAEYFDKFMTEHMNRDTDLGDFPIYRNYKEIEPKFKKISQKIMSALHHFFSEANKTSKNRGNKDKKNHGKTLKRTKSFDELV